MARRFEEGDAADRAVGEDQDLNTDRPGGAAAPRARGIAQRLLDALAQRPEIRTVLCADAATSASARRCHRHGRTRRTTPLAWTRAVSGPGRCQPCRAATRATATHAATARAACARPASARDAVSAAGTWQLALRHAAGEGARRSRFCNLACWRRRNRQRLAGGLTGWRLRERGLCRRRLDEGRRSRSCHGLRGTSRWRAR